MKKKRYISILFVSILILNIPFQNMNIIQKNQEDGAKEDFFSPLSTSNSIEHQWNETWGGIDDETAEAIAIDSLGNIYLAGYTNNTSSGDYDMCLVKFDSSGAYQWNVTWGESGEDHARAIALDSSDNIYLAGTLDEHGVDPDMCCVKFNNLGQYQWNSTLGYIGEDFAQAIALDSSGNIYLTGFVYDGGDDDVCLVKFDSNGQYQWNRTWGGIEDDRAFSIAVDSSDNIYLAGEYTIVDDIDSDFFLVKYNNLGEYQWNSIWGGDGMDMAFDLALASSDHIYLVGGYEIGPTDTDICLVCFDDSGISQWNRTWGGIYVDAATTIELDSSNNIYIGGATDIDGMGLYDFCLIECDNIGFQKWNHTWGGSGADIYWDLVLDSLEYVYLGGTWDMYGANPDMILIKYMPGPAQLSLNLPEQYDFFGNVAPSYNISITRLYDTLWYTIDDGTTNITASGLTGTINQTEWDKIYDSMFIINMQIIFYANDSFGREVYAEVTIYKDLIPPTSSIDYIPHSDTIQVNKSTKFTLTANDGSGSGLSLIRYRINNSGWIYYTNQFNLSSYEYGDYLISYQAVDLVDNVEIANTLLVRLVKTSSKTDIPGYSFLLFFAIISVISIFQIKKHKKSTKHF
ncbi:MAG: SBBP repeat-containing protein [Candidatus Thorarchaeota archaeon]